MGHSSTAGFWIPKQLLQALPLPQPKPHPPSRKRKSGATGRVSVSRGGGSGRRLNRPPREMSQQAGEEKIPSGKPLEEVQVSQQIPPKAKPAALPKAKSALTPTVPLPPA